MIYLASSSPRRRRLLKEAGLHFKVYCPPYKETGRGNARLLTRRHAMGKALSASSHIREGVILGADTVVVLEGRVLGKPRTMKHAERMLSSLSGRWHTVLTSVALLGVSEGVVRKKVLFTESTKVRIKKMTRKELKSYLKRIGPLDKAGAYAAQSSRGGVVEGLRGSFTNVVGLPMEKLKINLDMLR